MENNTCIYALVDPRTDEIRYVGRTNAPISRYSEHLNTDDNRFKQRWIRGLYSKYLLPTILVLDWVDQEQEDYYEQLWVNTLLKDGQPLLNIKLTAKSGSDDRVRPKIKRSGSQGRRPAVHTERVYQFMDSILEAENRVASYSEVQKSLDLASSTASKLRKQWLLERNLLDDEVG